MDALTTTLTHLVPRLDADQVPSPAADSSEVSEREFAAARRNKIRSYAQQFESHARVARQVTALWAAGLPMTALQSDIRAYENLDLARVNAAASKYAAASGMAILLVGDLARVEKGIRELKLGDVVVLDEYGTPVADSGR